MTGVDPAAYEAWYHTPRGRWIAECEFALLQRLLRPAAGASLLDVGCGSGHFSRRYAAAGLRVTGLDRDTALLAYARSRDDQVTYLHGDALALPCADGACDHCAAITSLCFISEPARALAELLRVARRSVVLGLLHRHSLLYRQKCGQGGYRGARWDTVTDVRRWLAATGHTSTTTLRAGHALWLPSGNTVARLTERLLPAACPGGGFLAIALHHKTAA
ncbi:MAG: class I SAM-dependent methyltransferase [Gammaproteobacteria bacterium]|nr:class I SAM-dependent methyltransferase [Gammaproteobacteria bacterium]